MWGGCWGRCGDADACVLFIFDLLIRGRHFALSFGVHDPGLTDVVGVEFMVEF